MFGKEKKAFNLFSGTDAGFYKSFAQFLNSVVWFDEYRNDIETKRVQLLKASFDGIGHVKSDYNSASNSVSAKTVNTPVNSSAMVSGQQMPVQDIALFTRVILLEYHKTEFTDKERENLEILRKMEKSGLVHITCLILSYRSEIENSYSSTFKEVYLELSDQFDSSLNIDTRTIKNMATIATTFKILEDKLPFPLKWEGVKDILVKNIISQNEKIKNSSETNDFWDTFKFLYEEGKILIDQHFRIQYFDSFNETVFSKPKPVLMFSFNRILQFILETNSRAGNRAKLDKSTLKNYIQHQKEYMGIIKSMKMGETREDGKKINTSVFVFDLEILKSKGYDFIDDNSNEEANYSESYSSNVF